jgi:spore germination cell wall hydrolase CwlJ-like protein
MRQMNLSTQEIWQAILIEGIGNFLIQRKGEIMIRIIKVLVFAMAAMIVLVAGQMAIDYKLDNLKTARMATSPVTAELRQRQLDCLARNIYHEAGGEPFEGKVAVAQVTLNRVESGQFPSDVCKVVYQKNVVYEKVLCQFSWYCEQASLKKPMNGPVYIESMEVAKKVLLEGFRLPSVKDALYFHGDYINPGWKRERVAKIGRHIFYK